MKRIGLRRLAPPSNAYTTPLADLAGGTAFPPGTARNTATCPKEPSQQMVLPSLTPLTPEVFTAPGYVVVWPVCNLGRARVGAVIARPPYGCDLDLPDRPTGATPRGRTGWEVALTPEAIPVDSEGRGALASSGRYLAWPSSRLSDVTHTGSATHWIGWITASYPEDRPRWERHCLMPSGTQRKVRAGRLSLERYASAERIAP